MNVLIGAPDLNNNNNSGFVTVYSSGNWAVPSYVTASDGVVGDRFGSSTSTSYNGSWFVVGAHWSNYTAGSVYVFNQTLSQVAKINKIGTRDSLDFFGASVRMSFTGETFMVAMTPSNLPGKVFVYEFNYTIGRFTCRTTLSEPSPEIASNRFASSIALAPDGKSVLVGAMNAGVVFKFDRSPDASWNVSHVFENPDADETDNFGTGIVYNGDTFVCGATGQNSSCGLSYIWTFSLSSSSSSITMATTTTPTTLIQTTGSVTTDTIGTLSVHGTTDIATKALSPISEWMIVAGAVGIFVGFLVIGGAVSCCIVMCRRFPFSSSSRYDAYSSRLDFSSEEMYDDLPVTPAVTIRRYDLDEEDDDPVFVDNGGSIYESIPADALKAPQIYHNLPHK